LGQTRDGGEQDRAEPPADDSKRGKDQALPAGEVIALWIVEEISEVFFDPYNWQKLGEAGAEAPDKSMFLVTHSLHARPQIEGAGEREAEHPPKNDEGIKADSVGGYAAKCGLEQPSTPLVPGDFAAHRGIAAAAGNINRVGCLHVTRFEPNPREDCVQMTRKNVGMRRQTPLRRPKAAKNRQCPACGAQSSRKQEPFVPVRRRSSGGFRFNCLIAPDMLVTGNKVGYGIRFMHHQVTALGDPLLQIPA
jgi:hypothetical protein